MILMQTFAISPRARFKKPMSLNLEFRTNGYINGTFLSVVSLQMMTCFQDSVMPYYFNLIIDNYTLTMYISCPQAMKYQGIEYLDYVDPLC